VAGIATLPTNFFSSILVQAPSLYNDAYSKVKAVGSMHLPTHDDYRSRCLQNSIKITIITAALFQAIESFWLLTLINLSMLGQNYNCFTHYLVSKIVIAIRYLTYALTF